MNADEALRRLLAHDWALAEERPRIEGLADLLARSLPEFDEEARELAVECLRNAPGAGSAMLMLARDPNVQIAAAAAQALADLPEIPPVPQILEAAAAEEEPFVRECLYRAAGRSARPGDLPLVRAAAAREADPEALAWTRAACLRLGGREERKPFLARLDAAPPDEAEMLAEALAYIGDATLTRGLLRWLDNRSPVFTLDPWRGEVVVRMCDLAVWTARRLGIRFMPEPDALRPYDDRTIAAAAMAIRCLGPE